MVCFGFLIISFALRDHSSIVEEKPLEAIVAYDAFSRGGLKYQLLF
jgi:hypothetical protein